MFLFIIVATFCTSALGDVTQQNRDATLELKTELIAPSQTSLPQYYQPPTLLNLQILKHKQEQLQNPLTLAQLLSLYKLQPKQPQIVQSTQQTQINPFLYLGQISLSDIKEDNSQKLSHQSQNLKPKSRSNEENIQNQENNSYVLYRPSADEPQEYVDLAPPLKTEGEPNYYAMLSKPRKYKKYIEEETVEKKLKAHKDTDTLKHQIRRSEAKENLDEYDALTESSDFVQKSEPTSRLDFQMHGHKGPKSYKFGFDFGSDAGLNRQFRVEERDSSGNVNGRYGYFDRKGKFRVVNYSSTAKDGFRVHS